MTHAELLANANIPAGFERPTCTATLCNIGGCEDPDPLDRDTVKLVNIYHCPVCGATIVVESGPRREALHLRNVYWSSIRPSDPRRVPG